MSTNPAIAGKILRNFSIVAVAVDRVISIGSRKQMAEGVRGQLQLHNANVRPQQD